MHILIRVSTVLKRRIAGIRLGPIRRISEHVFEVFYAE